MPSTTTSGCVARRSSPSSSTGEETDLDLLADVIDANLEGSLHGREFFVRKAIGWALRQHARTDPEWVRAFVDAGATGSPASPAARPSSTSEPAAQGCRHARSGAHAGTPSRPAPRRGMPHARCRRAPGTPSPVISTTRQSPRASRPVAPPAGSPAPRGPAWNSATVSAQATVPT